MERVPETFLLSEEDLREAITYWLNSTHFSDDDVEWDFDVSFDVQVKREVPKNGPFGGMTDPVEVKVITAKAVKED